MEQKEIIEGNKLIAEFMGYKKMAYKQSNEYMLTEIIEGVECAIDQRTIERMRYNHDWDWIMPVGKKIVETRNYHDCDKTLMIMRVEEAVSTFTIEPLFIAIIDFIQFYNALNK